MIQRRVRKISSGTSLGTVSLDWVSFDILVGEVNLGFLSSDFPSFPVVGSGGFLGGVEGAEPNSNPFSRVANLRRPFPPRTLPYAPVQVLPRPLCRLFRLPTICSRKLPTQKRKKTAKHKKKSLEQCNRDGKETMIPEEGTDLLAGTGAS